MRTTTDVLLSTSPSSTRSTHVASLDHTLPSLLDAHVSVSSASWACPRTQPDSGNRQRIAVQHQARPWGVYHSQVPRPPPHSPPCRRTLPLSRHAHISSWGAMRLSRSHSFRLACIQGRHPTTTASTLKHHGCVQSKNCPVKSSSTWAGRWAGCWDWQCLGVNLKHLPS